MVASTSAAVEVTMVTWCLSGGGATPTDQSLAIKRFLLYIMININMILQSIHGSAAAATGSLFAKFQLKSDRLIHWARSSSILLLTEGATDPRSGVKA